MCNIVHLRFLSSHKTVFPACSYVNVLNATECIGFGVHQKKGVRQTNASRQVTRLGEGGSERGLDFILLKFLY